ncbi:hypothetical protein COLO4_28199 [Corchorus olitorius]|uniref:Uncharacterized protein n=1 Tax=Corchorus olitorius TaxID=93759 RepID=A0A1R3HMD9_9ROSI|nr:hypothetical protein COLO4_28199 [Corchorus olitorius]
MSTSHAVSKRLKPALTKPPFDPRSIFSDRRMKLGFWYYKYKERDGTKMKQSNR